MTLTSNAIKEIKSFNTCFSKVQNILLGKPKLPIMHLNALINKAVLQFEPV